MRGVLRVWLLGLLAAAIWALSVPTTPAPLPEAAPAAQFSAARAGVVLARLLGGQKPHPAGSAENAAVHERLKAELQRLNIPVQTISGMSCAAQRGAIVCAEVSDIVAEAVPGNGPAILLMAHLDSVGAGPGAADDGSGVATILETLRAMKAQQATSRHPVIALFTDGEELGMLGASLFLNDPAWRKRIGTVVNVEARGNQGPSYLFQTSPGDAGLIDLYARAVPHPAASSLYGEIYKYLPNDTDLTPFLQAGLAGYNFAFIGDAAQYHTPRDAIANLSPGSLQSQGDNVLGLTRALTATDTLKRGEVVYLDVMGLLPRLPRGLALPLAIFSFLAIAWAGWRRQRRPGNIPAALLMPPLMLAGSVAIGFALHALAARVSGNPDPSFAYPTAFRIALAFDVWAALLLTLRWAGGTAGWLWLTGLGVVSAIFAPGLSPYFIFPAAFAGVALLVAMRGGRNLALLLAALAAMLVWIGLAAKAEAIMGLGAHMLFTIPVALGLIALLPVLEAQGMGVEARRLSIALSLLAALGAAIFAGFQPAYSAAQPQPLNLRYVEKDGKSWMLTDPVPRLPETLRAAAKFSREPRNIVAWRGYAADMGIIRLPVPSVSVTRQGSALVLDLHGSNRASGMMLIVPDGLAAATIAGTQVKAAPGRNVILCATPDCATARITLDFSAPVPKNLLLVEERYGLPTDMAHVVAARPDWAAPLGQGDMTYVATDVPVPY